MLPALCFPLLIGEPGACFQEPNHLSHTVKVLPDIIITSHDLVLESACTGYQDISNWLGCLVTF